jgi:hypothetical protein
MTNTPIATLLRAVIRWAVLAGFAYLALAYLNSAFYSAWVSGGPPNPHPLGWSRRALVHLSFSLAAVFLGVGLFRATPRLPSLSRSDFAIVAIGVALVVAPYVGRFVLAQSCSLEGGRWSNETIECEK